MITSPAAKNVSGDAVFVRFNDGVAAGRTGVPPPGTNTGGTTGGTTGGGDVTVTVADTVGDVTPAPWADAKFTIEPAVTSALVTVYVDVHDRVPSTAIVVAAAPQLNAVPLLILSSVTVN